MSSFKDSLAIADRILRSPSRSLKELAELSGRDVFSFYRGANLSRLDLASQDLTGLNFEGADIRFSNLSGAKFDTGALNGCLIDKSQYWVKDRFEFYFDDLNHHDDSEILFHYRLRPGLVDEYLSALEMTYRSFAKIASVSEGALRKARSEGALSYDTAHKVMKHIIDLANGGDGLSIAMCQRLRQPHVQFLSHGINSPFRIVSREEYNGFCYMRRVLIEDQISRGLEGKRWRDTPEYLEWNYRYRIELGAIF